MADIFRDSIPLVSPREFLVVTLILGGMGDSAIDGGHQMVDVFRNSIPLVSLRGFSVVTLTPEGMGDRAVASIWPYYREIWRVSMMLLLYGAGKL